MGRCRTRTEGDVFARVLLRIDEMSEARDLIRAAAGFSRDRTSAADCRATCECGTGDALGWAASRRGQVLDWVRLRDGVVDRAVIRDPSSCNWRLFGELGPGNSVPDFPLCNKSLNLSYSGTDL